MLFTRAGSVPVPVLHPLLLRGRALRRHLRRRSRATFDSRGQRDHGIRQMTDEYVSHTHCPPDRFHDSNDGAKGQEPDRRPDEPADETHRQRSTGDQRAPHEDNSGNHEELESEDAQKPPAAFDVYQTGPSRNDDSTHACPHASDCSPESGDDVARRPPCALVEKPGDGVRARSGLRRRRASSPTRNHVAQRCDAQAPLPPCTHRTLHLGIYY